MKIAFCGDSFCANIHNGTWPFLIKTELNATSIWKGTQGANQYHILSDAKKVLITLKPDLIIFTHTDPYRLANRHNEPLGARPCERVYSRLLKENKNNLYTLKKTNKDNIWTAGHMYYEHLMEFGFHELTHSTLVKECYKICMEANIKHIHLFSFSTKELGFRDYDWDVQLPGSYNEKSLARISYDYQTPDDEKQHWVEKGKGHATLPNHMNYEGNKLVSKIVLDMLK